MSEQQKEPRLYICGTPIGNLEDITLRVLRILKEVDFIACEDTRVTRKLLASYQIQKELVAYHEHNKIETGEKIALRLLKGESCALVSDAGMPGINDPGTDLINLCIRDSIAYTVLPGPSAFLTALIYSGFKNDRFTYAGFFPRINKEKNVLLQELKDEKNTMVFYESPHRIEKTADWLAEHFPERNIAVVREISKVYEEMISGKAIEVKEKIRARTLKGEMVLIIEGEQRKEEEKVSPEELESLFRSLLEEGMSKKEAVKKLVEISGFSKNEIYQKFMIK